jgi:2-polyprenyl-3-methyl-5-hydroxy-6-metoxy-1,4-benzoquinol methylase
MHKWTDAEFAERVYNEQYVLVDPDFTEVRPAGFADLIYSSFGDHTKLIKHLDFGGGSGLLSATLRQHGMDSVNYDPFHGDAVSLPDGKFNFISAFEVFEHASQIDRLMGQLFNLAAADCAIIFSTLLSDGQINEIQRLQWWYAAPRNGHVSLFSRRSLDILGRRWGFQFGSFDGYNGNLHAFWRGRPAWAHFIDQLAVAG